MNINLRPGEIISQNKLAILKLASENGQLTLEVNPMECLPNYDGKATAFDTCNIAYLVGYVNKNYITLQQIATGPDGVYCKYYCAASNGFGYIEVSPEELQNYAYVIVPDMFLVE